MICPICHHKTKLLLCPEYSSSGIWCQECGLSFGNPKESFEKLPEDLIKAIEGWNFYWELYNNTYIEPTAESYKYFIKTFVPLGKLLSEEVNKYYECILGLNKHSFFVHEKCVDCDPIDNPKCDRCLGS
jgi:hypothetical protein